MMTQMKKKSHQDQISPDIIRPFFPNFTRNCQKPSFKKYLQQMPHNLKALLPPQIKSKKRKGAHQKLMSQIILSTVSKHTGKN